MYKNKTPDAKNNLSGQQIRNLRKQLIPKMSQRMLAEKMQLIGLDMDKNAIQRIESGSRFVTDIELAGFMKVFNISANILLGLSIDD